MNQFDSTSIIYIYVIVHRHVICQLPLSAIRITAFSHSLNTEPAILRIALLYVQVSC